MSKTYTVTITVKVFSERNLKVGAELHAKEKDGLGANEWAEIRAEDHDFVAADLTMLLDPGSLPGCEILQTEVEKLP